MELKDLDKTQLVVLKDDETGHACMYYLLKNIKDADRFAIKISQLKSKWQELESPDYLTKYIDANLEGFDYIEIDPIMVTEINI